MVVSGVVEVDIVDGTWGLALLWPGSSSAFGAGQFRGPAVSLDQAQYRYHNFINAGPAICRSAPSQLSIIPNAINRAAASYRYPIASTDRAGHGFPAARSAWGHHGRAVNGRASTRGRYSTRAQRPGTGRAGQSLWVAFGSGFARSGKCNYQAGPALSITANTLTSGRQSAGDRQCR